MPVGCFNRILPWTSTCRSNTINNRGSGNLPVSKLKIQTLFDVIYCGLQVNRYNQCIGNRDESNKYLTYHWITCDQLVNESRLLASGLLQLTLSPGQGTKIAIYASNCSQWVVSLFALFHESMIAVPIYDCINDNDYTCIVNETQIKCIITDTPERTHKVIRGLKETPSVKMIISRDEPWREDIAIGEDNNCQVHSLAHVMTIGANSSQSTDKFHIPQRHHIAEICYTPGTTGKPKGVILTHANLVASLEGINCTLSQTLGSERETLFLFVSLTHPFSLIAFLSTYVSGGRVAMFSGEMCNLIADIKLVEPTILLVIPRFLDNIYNRIVYSVKGNPIKSKMMEYSIKLSTRQDALFKAKRGKLLSSLVFAGERAKILGDNIRLIISGTGALSSNVLQFLRIALGCIVINSYGLTETAGFTALTSPDDLLSLHTGSPLKCNEIKLIDSPEFGHYVNTSGIGEICVRGLNVSSLYYKRESEGDKLKKNEHQEEEQDDRKPSQSETDRLSCDNWFHTGDIGTLTPRGSLRVIERKENIVKLHRGLFISLEKVESIYNQSAFVSECFVDSDSEGKFFVAIVVPEVDYLNAWCISNSILLNTEQACSDFLFKHHVIIDMIRIGEREGLKSFQQVRDIHLHPRPFSIENNLLTPNYMTRRRYCKMYFQQIIQDLILYIDRQEENEMSELTASLGLW